MRLFSDNQNPMADRKAKRQGYKRWQLKAGNYRGEDIFGHNPKPSQPSI
jgi:hypothetical protein